MIKPVLQDDAFLADFQTAFGDRDHLHLWWLGQSGFLLLWQEMSLLIDPYLSDSLTKKYANTDKPHVRMSERVVAPQRLAAMPVIATHNHTDHLDPDTLRPIFEPRCSRLFAPAAWRLLAADRAGISPAEVIPMDAGSCVDFIYFQITAIPSAHDQLERNAEGHYKYLGYIVRAGPWTLYHSGDTVVYPGMVEHLRPHAIDIAILPINGKLGNMNGRDAARLAKDINAKLVIPCHYDMFEFNTASPDEFVAECRRLGQPCRVLQQGERFTYPSKP